jgi:hypothetical protein
MRAACRVLTMAVAVAAAAVPAAGVMVTVSPSGNTYLRSSASNANQGSDTFPRVNASPNRTLIRFDQELTGLRSRVR